ncbi:MAG: alpha-E domain-containing protein [Blautia sp.]|mgnify:FL=1|uniref:alpha-E domain-containing protein n=1 Tax=Blautia TaxID=572511 RepID=UPI00047B70CE|nr:MULTISPECIES: alpha-E domain-containing protein [Blautia]MDD6412823.1 alpha-E domain-containing protein [Blautia sp.]
MGIISVEQASRLYWLGRYTERVYSTIRMFFKSYDRMIDTDDNCYKEFCASVDIPDIYESKEDFLKRYPFDETNPDSIISNLNRAYDNAIVLRENISTEALSYIQLAIYEMCKAKESSSPLFELQHVLDEILAFWGNIDDRIDSEEIRNIIKAGKRIERVDLYARLGAEKEEIQREVHRMIPRVTRSGLSYQQEKLNNVKLLAEQEDLNYYEIVANVEQIF